MSTHDIFISYARGTAQANARALRDALLERGRTVFLDEREIPYGSPFPQDIADGLTESRVTVVFLDERYLTRPFCVHELQVITAPARGTGGEGVEGTRHVVVALPDSGDAGRLVPYLPPPVANRSWPTASQTDVLASMVDERLAAQPPSLGDRLRAIGDDTVRRLRVGGQIPLPSSPADTTPADAPAPAFAHAIPDSRGDGFIGREHDLWRIVDALVTPRAFGTPVSCAVQGPGGCGKSQLAAEFAWRYGRRFFPGGLVWITGEGGDTELADQLGALLPLLDPEAGRAVRTPVDAADRLKILQQAVASATRGRGGTPILWVVDSIPEAGRGAPPAPVQRWCPAPESVALLCTSRRAGIEGVGSTIELRPLAGDAAVTLLTRPPVDASWLAAHEWAELATWVGDLPLALAILRDSLTNGFTTARALARARGQEPVALMDSLVDALRGEVADSYLRGVTEAFELSYAGLGDPPALRDAAHLFARLASSPIHEELAETLVPPALTGRLAKRSWIQPTGGASGRRWTMHRIPASFLRTHSADPSAEYARLFSWLRSLLTSPAERLREYDLHTHLQVITSEFLPLVAAEAPPAGALDTSPAVQAARTFAIEAATIDLTNADLRGLRFLAAGLADATGAASATVARLGDPKALGDEAARNLAHVLAALPDSPDAAAVMEQLLADPRPRVRHAAVTHASRGRFLSVGLAQLRAVLAETEAGTQRALSASLDWILGPDNPRLAEVLDWLLDMLAHGAAHERTGAAVVLLRVLIVHADDSGLVRHHVADIRRTLLAAALAAPDDVLALEAADAAGAAFDGDDVSVIQQALEAAQDDVHRDRVILVLARYTASGQRPSPPRTVTAVWGRDGSLQVQGQLGTSRTIPRSAYDILLGSLRVATAARTRTEAMQALAHPNGIRAVGDEIGRRLDGRAFGAALELADSFVACARGIALLIVNGQWWRAQALEGLGRTAEAIAAYDAAIAAAPPTDAAVAPLYERRAILRTGAGDFASALPDLDRALQLTPGAFRAHHLRSLCLYNLDRPAEAQAAAERALAIDDGIGEAWFFRAIARYAQGDAQGALDDLEHSVALEPRDERAASFLSEIRRYLGR